MKWIISDVAEADLETISDHVALENPAAATRLIDQLLDSCATIGENPLAYPVARFVQGLALRRKVMGQYLVFYLAHDTHVEIVRVLHGARNIDQIVGD